MSRALFFLLFFPTILLANDPPSVKKKVATAQLLVDEVNLDGKLNEPSWEGCSVLTNFITREPNPGAKADQKTEIRVQYNQESLYIGAFMHENGAENILQELSQRDNFSNSDYFGVYIDAYKDGINGVGFIVTAAGVQIDSKLSALGEDYSWNAVWDSKVTVSDTGWVVEMEIPYSALRFPDSDEQEWHINFTRSIRRIRENSFWSQVDPQVNGFFNQAGLLQGVENVQTPVRLQLYPYMSGYLNTSGGQQTYSVNGGMDIKYGLSDAFTLDMTLIPDFGQVQSDNQVLNLTPFEVRFNERRQFFTEGTELFNKGGLFYSRRIGGRPLNFFSVAGQLEEGEVIVENPDRGNLVNATKVSGRTKSGLGVGVFNAVSAPTYARIRNTEGEERQIQTDPLTNYSVVVLDQNLRSNSYVTLINTNVMRNGNEYDANVIGTQFDVRNKQNSISVYGGGAYNKKFGLENQKDDGFRHNIGISKVSGNVNYGMSYYIESDTYDPNDLGFIFNNNSFSKNAWLSYNRYQPIWFLNRFGLNFNVGQNTLYKGDKFVSAFINTNGWFTTKKFDSFGFSLTRSPYVERDYFEPRTPGYVFKTPANTNYNLWVSSDYRKTFALDVNFSQTFFDERQGPYLRLGISPRVRVSNKFSIIYSVSNELRDSEFGYAVFNSLGSDDAVGFNPDAVYFARRRRSIHEQVLNLNYIFTNRMGLTARFRHYWSEVGYGEFFELEKDGTLYTTEYAGVNSAGRSLHNTSFNAFNVDIVFRWVFLPGSEVSVVWKDAILTARNQLALSYRDNIDHTFGAVRSDSFSIKVLYFVDYHRTFAKKRAAKRSKI